MRAYGSGLDSVIISYVGFHVMNIEYVYVEGKRPHDVVIVFMLLEYFHSLFPSQQQQDIFLEIPIYIFRYSRAT